MLAIAVDDTFYSGCAHLIGDMVYQPQNCTLPVPHYWALIVQLVY